MKDIWPSDFTRVVMIPLPKKMNAVECSDHRTISLISHASKILLKILNNRIEAKARDIIGRTKSVWIYKRLWYERCNWSHENDMREESGIHLYSVIPSSFFPSSLY